MSTKLQAVDTPSRQILTDTDTELIEDDLPVMVINTDITDATKVRLEIHQQSLDQVDYDKEILKEWASHTVAELI